MRARFMASLICAFITLQPTTSVEENNKESIESGTTAYRLVR